MERWRQLAIAQSGVLARRQLLELGYDRHYVDRRVSTERWQHLSSVVVATTTGPLTWEQRLWFGALHCGGTSIVGGLTAAARHGLGRWDRDDVCVLVDDELKFDPAPGLRIVRTRRPLALFRDPRSALPLCRLEPAVLLHAAYTRSGREANGLLAACVQQGLTSAPRLHGWVLGMRPLRRSKQFQRTLAEIAVGAQSLAEIDVARMCRWFGLRQPHRQVRRRDATGRLRYTDAEWTLADGRVVVLEIDGAFHAEVEHWENDIARQRALTSPDRFVVRATAREVREEPRTVARDLIRLGVPGRGSQRAL